MTYDFINLALLAASLVFGGGYIVAKRQIKAQEAKHKQQQLNAQIERYITGTYPETMTEEECREMSAGRWS